MKTFPDLEQQKSDLLRALAQWQPSTLTERPAAGQWSALEIVDHLVRTEKEILSAVRQGIARPRWISPVDRARTRFLQAVFLSDRRVRAPAGVPQIMPGPDLDLDEINARWSLLRIELHALTQAAPPQGLRRAVFRHPVGGWMGLAQVINFFSAHLTHHDFQFARLQRSLAAGSGAAPAPPR